MEVIPHALSPEENFYAGIADAESTALALVIEALINLGQPQEEIDLEEIISAPGFASLEEAVRQAQENNQDILTLSSSITQAQAIADYIVNPPSPTPAPAPTPIDIAAIPGVTVPETGVTPVTTITETAQYTGTVTWAPTDNPFAGETVYTATITLTPKTGFTLAGVNANFFTVAGTSSPATNAADSGVVTAPVTGATPVLSITETAQYTGTVTWIPADDPFLGSTVYTATITLTAKLGFTLTGVAENFFTVAGATATNPINSGVVTAVFLVVGANYGGGKVAYILQSGDPGYDVNVQHGLIAATADQSTGIQWYNGSNVTTGAIGTAIGFGQANTAVIVVIQGTGSYAAQLCDDLTEHGYNDWFLPSKDELKKLWLNKDAIGGFADFDYWSSSENYANLAWSQGFYGGSQLVNNKNYYLRVRAVRAF
jgi:hypothetical protein